MNYIRCERCNYKYGQLDHVCVDFRAPRPDAISLVRKKPTTVEKRVVKSERTIRERKHRDATVIRLYNEGQLTSAQIAKEVGVSQTTVVAITREAAANGLVELRSRGWRPPNSRPQEVVDRYARIEKLYLEGGRSQAEIAEMIGCSLVTVSKALREGQAAGRLTVRKRWDRVERSN